ncbi:pyridoxal-dependent decarboxylase, exosortase A system-associated [Noviherbaspirillum galbum]|uniref:Pyridoxal-dependent decarboxylase, exosortase A system-associated n=1 Tax=Noviherbaspirillum galbum TaxID=2709383 RepID=A0A6B3STS4_9BURK|nr:pyridoxal-dependent decarboxylase, exosortase A system-associated [Noviherbaspirillum galbum]NEX64137.1 pyridoxal-dependent decarboxylase, exosortase A system-associated [Noviherbaspirillum galbum]
MSGARPVHPPQTRFAVRNDNLCVGGIELTRLAQRAGQTPFYVYDRAQISERVAQLRQHLPRQIELHYAIKANPMPAVVQHLAGLVDGFDVASGGELRVALDTTMPARCVSFAGPGKSDAELASAVASGCVINMESAHEMERIAALGDKLSIRPTVAIRVNPDFELKSSGMRMGGGAKQFGIDAEQVPEVLARLRKLDLDFEGLHIFSGSQSLRADALREAQEKTLHLAIRLQDSAGTGLRTLNIGGGLGVPYFPGEQSLDLATVGAGLHELIPLAEKNLPHTRLIIELGRFLVAEAGIYVCRVIERKESRGQVFLVTDGGLHHHLAASGNFGQVIRKNYPVAIGNRMQGAVKETVSVVGPLCTPLDLLADQMELPKAGPGDLVVVFQSGAYGLTASPTAFLSHPAPAEMLV